jgi:hypothetical protein
MIVRRLSVKVPGEQKPEAYVEIANFCSDMLNTVVVVVVVTKTPDCINGSQGDIRRSLSVSNCGKCVGFGRYVKPLLLLTVGTFPFFTDVQQLEHNINC